MISELLMNFQCYEPFRKMLAPKTPKCFLLILLLVPLNGNCAIDYEEQVAREVESQSPVSIAVRPRPPFSNQPLAYYPEPLRKDYSREELEFINQLQALAKQSRRSLISSLKPQCYFENWTGLCCINLSVNLNKKTSLPAKTCVETGLRLTDLSAFAAVHFNNFELIAQEYKIGKICWGLPPPLSKIRACLWVYHAAIDFKSRSFEFCSMLEITQFFQVGFNCIVFKNGKFSISEAIQPQEKGLVSVRLVGGRLKFEVTSPQGSLIKYWFGKAWGKFAGLFRKKSVKFLDWMRPSGRITGKAEL